MIYVQNKPVLAIRLGEYVINRVYAKDLMFWPRILEILSCYSNGYWMDEYGWTDDTKWSDNIKTN